MKLTLGQISELLSATGATEGTATAAAYSIDSRTLAPGELFFAVRGERLDGHDFVEAALERGAVAAVVSRQRAPRYPEAIRPKLLAVEDTLVALQALGAAVRRRWGKTLIAVTGSTGKTTTKDAIAHVLAGRYRVLKSEGNLNNHFGLPLQLLRLEPEHEVAVVELAMSRAGEIAALARIAQPNVGVVTNVAPVHLGFFNSVAEIARAKYELIASLPGGSTAVLNADDEYVSLFGRDFHGRVVSYALEHPADVRADAIGERGAQGSAFEIVAGSARQKATLPLLGRHNIYNALAAVAVALQPLLREQAGMPLADATAALATLAPSPQRGQVMELEGVTVINDCYNSNPKALNAMVDALAGMAAKRRIVVAGEMLELGPAGEQLHRECGRRMAGRGIRRLLGVRGAARFLVEAAKQEGLEAEFLETPEEAGEWLARNARAGDAVLLKASRGVRLERALEAWQARRQTVKAGK
ncbi:MAG: UDP-N-acetylmuramoyl-tripeptide--D-alanyl-D-alanine ligase [Terriglobales bacterium]